MEQIEVLDYKKIDVSLDQFLYFFHEDSIEDKLLSAYEVGGVKGFKSEFYRKIYAYQFFMIKRASNEEYKPIELLNFIHDQQLKRIEKECPPKAKPILKSKKRKVYIDPNQMNLVF